MLRLPAVSRLILTVFKLRTVTKMIKEITCLSVMKVMISRTLLIPRQISMATYIFWPAHHPPSAQIIMMMKHPPYPALLHPVEVAAPSKRGPSAFILASLIETELSPPLREDFTLLPLAQASGRYKGQVDGNLTIAKQPDRSKKQFKKKNNQAASSPFAASMGEILVFSSP